MPASGVPFDWEQFIALLGKFLPGLQTGKQAAANAAMAAEIQERLASHIAQTPPRPGSGDVIPSALRSTQNNRALMTQVRGEALPANTAFDSADDLLAAAREGPMTPRLPLPGAQTGTRTLLSGALSFLEKVAPLTIAYEAGVPASPRTTRAEQGLYDPTWGQLATDAWKGLSSAVTEKTPTHARGQTLGQLEQGLPTIEDLVKPKTTARRGRVHEEKEPRAAHEKVAKVSTPKRIDKTWR